MQADIEKVPSILIVDDEPANLHVLNDAVKDLGQIYFAKNGIAALNKATECRPEVILLDIEMPDINGYQVLEQLKSKPNFDDASVIFVTGHSANDHEIQALESGGVDFIQKPINLSVTRARVKTQLTLQAQKHQIRRAAEDLSLLVRTLPAFVAYWDPDLNNVFCNDVLGTWFGIKADQMRGQSIWDVLPESGHELLKESIESLNEGKHSVLDIPCGQSGKNNIYGQITLVPRSIEGAKKGFLMLISDITQRKIAEEALINEKERIRVTLNSIGDAVIATDLDGNVTFLNPIAEDMTGWTSQEAAGQPIEIIMPLQDGDTEQVLRNPIRIALEEGRTAGMTLNCKLMKGEGTTLEVEDSAAPIRNHLGEVTGAIIVFHDVSEARAMAIKMTHIAQHDVLTNLPNRLLLRDRAMQALQKSRRTKRKVALLLFDIDHFKNINETLGHDAGDRMIKMVSHELSGILREDDTLCRQGGDEFIILLSEVNTTTEITRFVSRLFEVFDQDWKLDEHSFRLTVSLGIAISPDDSHDLDELYRHADAAMFTAKKNGRDGFQFYSQEIEKRLLLKKELEVALKHQAKNREFEVHYQPKVDVKTGNMVGAEALVRWRKPDGSLINPLDFIPLAEDTGLILPLGKWVLKEACRQAKVWHDFNPGFRVAINISIVQFEDVDFIDEVKNILIQSQVKPEQIEFEITESVLANDTENATNIINELKSLGVKIALDDFGTGYSSLSYIKGFPLDVLKIDQSFVKNMLHSSVDQAIIAAIIQMAKGLELRLVAEGVETNEHAEYLETMGCEIMQGYLYSKPIPEFELSKIIDKQF
ncbi:EAL domain-containing protein [Pleionea sediminis]|uniref:EAL domain-containing protein n=1 Tax=Pleionea sediminis TaxID=2569479 RepID=UPI001185D21C|nr:EAL domain-containing protein [Pleionea sediminis]